MQESQQDVTEVPKVVRISGVEAKSAARDEIAGESAVVSIKVLEATKPNPIDRWLTKLVRSVDRHLPRPREPRRFAPDPIGEAWLSGYRAAVCDIRNELRYGALADYLGDLMQTQEFSIRASETPHA